MTRLPPWLFLLLLLAWPAAAAGPLPAVAEPAPAAAERAQLVLRGNLAQVDAYLTQAFASVRRSAAQMALRLQPAGERLLGALALLLLAWTGLRNALAGAPLNQSLADVAGILLVGSALYGALARWGWLAGVVEQSFDYLAVQLRGAPLRGGEAAQAAALALDPALSILATAVRLPASLLPTELLLWGLALALKLAVVLVALLCGGIYVSMYLLSVCLFAVAVALGPVMLPWLLGGPFGFLFDGWLRFLVSAALYKLLGVVFIVLAGALRDPIAAASTAAAGAGGEGVDLAGTAGALLLCVALATLMLQIPGIARTLAGGRAWRSGGWL